MAKTTHVRHNGFPWMHLVGYLLSMVLTVLAIWVSFNSGFSVGIILWVIYIFAFLQAALQLIMFMHMTESSSANLQTGTILFALFIAIVVVTGSVWVMSSGHA